MRVGILGSKHTIDAVLKLVNKENMFIELVRFGGIEDCDIPGVMEEIQGGSGRCGAVREQLPGPAGWYHRR